MGILNVTPDSFYDGGKYNNTVAILDRVSQMVKEGVDIIDIGAYSSRPGASDVSEEEEISRLDTALSLIRPQFPNVMISVDTYRASVAKIMVEKHQVDIINDISGGDMDVNMFETVAKLNVPYIMMHMQGTPQNMQNNPNYSGDVVCNVINSFSKKVEELKNLGVHDVILDPGFGFGKTLEHNYTILKRLKDFDIFELPLLIGISRKSMIYKQLNITPQESLNGTTALNMVALQNGASILRVHDVKEAKECISLYCKLQSVINI